MTRQQYPDPANNRESLIARRLGPSRGWAPSTASPHVASSSRGSYVVTHLSTEGSPMASLELTDSSQLTDDGFENLPDQIIYPYTPNHMICENMCLAAVTSDSQHQRSRGATVPEKILDKAMVSPM
uniref:Uncharacterized protein n=1 Tax=Timema poppense TaxID=170557 RepID=A0A7R9DAB8_TIMPO|nr:unnamed protein product [Timema poppensis]